MDGTPGVVVVVRGGVRGVLDCGIAGIDVSCRDGLVLTYTRKSSSAMTVATANPTSAHTHGRGPRSGSGGVSPDGGCDPLCG